MADEDRFFRENRVAVGGRVIQFTGSADKPKIDFNPLDSDGVGKPNSDRSFALDYGIPAQGLFIFDPLVVAPATDYVHFYEMGDSGGTLIADTTGNQDLVNSISPASVQVTDAIQGEVAQFVASAGFTNLGLPIGNVDKSFTVLINSDDVTSTTLFSSTVPLNIVSIFNANRISITTDEDDLDFTTTATMVVDTWFELGMSITSDFRYRLYLNGVESTTGEVQGTATLDLDKFSDDGSPFNEYTGFGAKFRSYDRILAATEMFAIDAFDRKV